MLLRVKRVDRHPTMLIIVVDNANLWIDQQSLCLALIRFEDHDLDICSNIRGIWENAFR